MKQRRVGMCLEVHFGRMTVIHVSMKSITIQFRQKGIDKSEAVRNSENKVNVFNIRGDLFAESALAKESVRGWHVARLGEKDLLMEEYGAEQDAFVHVPSGHRVSTFSRSCCRLGSSRSIRCAGYCTYRRIRRFPSRRICSFSRRSSRCCIFCSPGRYSILV